MADDGSGRAALYALEAIVSGLRDAGILTPKALEAIERRTQMGLDYAGAIDFAGRGFDPKEPHAIRHGMWCAREFIAPTGDQWAAIDGHPGDLRNWRSLEERLAYDPSESGE